jgi:xanthine dehydrogenase accessory factor
MKDWGERIEAYIGAGQLVCRIVVAEAKGSTPREAGADMYVTQAGIWGTIGGGALEFEAMKIARQMLAELADTQSRFARQFRNFPLGPNLGQCCGGQVTLLFEGFTPDCLAELTAILSNPASGYIHQAGSLVLAQLSPKPVAKISFDSKKQTLLMPPILPNTPLYLYGAGHVGRAVMGAVSGLALDRVWVDTDKSRFPEDTDLAITLAPATDMTIIAEHAPPGAIHIVMSYSHALDEALVYTILRKGNFAKLGLIGSRTKKQRFCNALKKRGIDEAALKQLICPIGLPDLRSKSPAHVGLSIAAQIAIWLEKN